MAIKSFPLAAPRAYRINSPLSLTPAQTSVFPEMVSFLGSLTGQVPESEYLHVLLNPLPVHGLFIATFGLIFGFVFRSPAARTVSLALILISAAAAWPVYHYGGAGYDRVLSLTDTTGGLWLEEHVHRAEKLLPAFWILAALSASALLVPLKRPRTACPLGVVTLCAALFTLVAGGWIAYAGGRVRHKEFRDGPPVGAAQSGSRSDHAAQDLK